MTPVLLVASNTFRQTLRQRLFLNIVIFGAGLLALAVVVSFLSYGYPYRVVRSLGLSGVGVALNLMAVFLSVSLVHQEIDRKTLFVVLTRPMSRMQYVVGRYLGLMYALVLVLLGFSAAYVLALWQVNGTLSGLDVLALGACLPEAAILAAFGLIFSCFSTPTLSAGIALGFWIAASTTDDLVRLTDKADAFTQTIAQGVYYTLPALSRFDFREAAVYLDPVTASETVFVFLYGGVYAAALVLVAGLVLAKREMI